MRFFLLFLPLCFLVGCDDPNAQQSSIVREVEAAGSGNLDVSSPNGLGLFFANRPALAVRIDRECKGPFSQGDAHWAETAEARVCFAAHSNLPATQWKSDGKGY